MLGFDAVAKLPLAAAAGASSPPGLASGSFTVGGQPAGFNRLFNLACEAGSSSVSGGDCNALLGKVIVAAGAPYIYTGLAVALDATWYDMNSSARLVTFKFIRANTVSIIAEDRIMKIEPRLRKSN